MSGLGLALSRCTSLHKNRYGILLCKSQNRQRQRNGTTHGLRNELQRERKSASQARSILWLGGFPGRSVSSVSEDEINQESQDTKEHDEEKIDEACPFVGNDDNHQHKNHDQRKQRQDSAYTVPIVGSGCGCARATSLEFLAGHISIVNLIGRLAARLFCKLRVLLIHRNISRVVKLFFFPLITNDLARSCRGREASHKKEESHEACSRVISAECMSRCASHGQLERRARGEGPSSEELQRIQELGLADNETRNAYYAQQHRDLDLTYVRDWDRRANERLLTALAALPESRLLEPDWWTFGRALGSVFDVDHDREHAQDIQRWLGQS